MDVRWFKLLSKAAPTQREVRFGKYRLNSCVGISLRQRLLWRIPRGLDQSGRGRRIDGWCDSATLL